MAVIVVMIALFSFGTWSEVQSAYERDRESACLYLEYDFEGNRQESLDASEQARNRLYECGLDLPLAEGDEDDSDL